MTCPACRADNPPENRFCDQCGAPLETRCPACQAALRPGARFCGTCGQRLGAPTAATVAPPVPAAAAAPPAAYTPRHLADKILKGRSALEGERRQVTVLFADLAGFTTLAERRDPEEVHSIIDRCFEIITAEVHRFEGTVNQYTGDGVMALFGAPIAHEDSARRAAHAALGIQRAMRDLAQALRAERGIDLALRIGLNTGPVVVGRIGDDLRMDYTAVGDTTNTAARMQQTARAGSVVVSEATQRALAGFFETLDLGEIPVKGRTPVRAFEVLRPRGRRSRLEVAAERGLTPLVGRTRELDVLMDRFREVRAGRGQVVVLVGEAGMGKSRLLLEFRRRLAEAGEAVTWLEGQCVSFGQSIPFLPLTDQLRRNFGIEELDGEPEIIAKVEHGMRRMGRLDEHIPYVRALLAVDPGDPAVAAMDPAARRKRVFAAVRALSLRGAAIRPIVFVFEDLHWVDRSTEEYLGSLLDSVASVPILLLLTYRVGYTPPFGTRSFQTTVMLQSLSEAEAMAVAARVLGTDSLPEEVRAALSQKAEGVPLFVEEVTKTLLDLGVLRAENGGYRMARGVAEVSVPDTINGIIMARLDRLGEDGKRTVQLASVIGRQFLVRLLERIAGLTTQLEGLLGELKALEIVYELGALPEPAYIFKHAVIQDVAYNSLLLQRRRELHRAVGHAIEELYADRLTDHLEELAHHFRLGEVWPKAFEYSVRAGDKARAAYASQAALDAYAAALEAAQRGGLPAAAVLGVRQARSRLLVLLSRHQEAIAEAEAMLAAAREAGDRRAEGEGLADLAHALYATFTGEHFERMKAAATEAVALGRALGDGHVVARGLTTLGAALQVEGDLAAADEAMEESLRISAASGLKDTVAGNQLWLAAHANWRGEFRRAISLAGRAIDTAAGFHDEWNESVGLAFLCLAHVGVGEYREGLAVINDALARARERSSIFNIGRLTNSLGWLYQELGDFRRAYELDREAAELGRAHRIPNVEISSLINLGLDHLHLGEPRRALDTLEEIHGRVERAFGAHRWRWSAHLLVYLAETLLALDEPARALAEAERGLAQARATSSWKYVGKALALRGEIALRQGDPARAEHDLAEALATARRIEYPTLTWQAGALLARVQAERGRAEAAAETARVAAAALDLVAAGAPEPALAASFRAWPRVERARESLVRLAR